LQAKTKSRNEKPIIVLPLLNGTSFTVSQNDVDGWQGAYPAVDIVQELQRMKAWLDANPGKRKPLQGIRRFIVNWLNGAQQKAGKQSGAPPVPPLSAEWEEFFRASCI